MQTQLEHDIAATRALIADPSNWCQGETVLPRLGGGWQRCLAGAVIDACEEDSNRRQAAISALDAECTGNLIRFNDTNPHHLVLAAIDRALANLRAERGVKELAKIAVAAPACEPEFV